MADKNEAPVPSRVPLLANSYDFQALDKALTHAHGLKTEDGRKTAIAKLVRDEAQLQEVIENLDKPALPDGTVMGRVIGADGVEVDAPVSVPAKEDEMPVYENVTVHVEGLGGRRAPRETTTEAAD